MNGVAVSTAGFTLIALGVLVTTLRSRRRQRGLDAFQPGQPQGVATFTELIRGVAALPAGRAILLASWCWVGWHLLAR